MGTTTDHYDGLNYDTTNDGTVYTGGFTGADVLANNCVLPTAGGADVATVTVTVLQPTTVEVTVPGTPVPVPPTTITAPVTVTLSIPAVTTTTPGTTAVVTAAGSTTTVTLPAQTVTVPASAKTHTVVVTVTGPSHQIFLPPHAVKEIVTAKHLVRTIFKTVVRACKGGVAGAETSVTGQGKG